MPPFIDIDLGNDVKDRECAPESEYELVVESVAVKDKDYDGIAGHYIELVHQIEGVEAPGFKGVYHYLSLPNSGDDKDKAYNKQAGIKRYLLAAGIEFDAAGFSPEDIQGARFTAKLDVEVDDNGQYAPKNRLVLPSINQSEAA